MNREIVIKNKGQFTLESYENKPLIGDEIYGKTLYTLVSQGTELGWSQGDDFPIYPGYSTVFEVTKIGKNVTGIAIGDKRFAMGPHRSSQQHKACLTLPIPDGLCAKKALLARLMGVSMTSLMTTRAKAGDKVIITGAGPVGLLAAHLFTKGGYDVTLVDPDTLRQTQAGTSGLKSILSAMPLEDKNYLKKVALVLDCSGHEQALLDGCNIVRPLGEIIQVGVPWKQNTTLSAHDILSAIFINLVTLRSGWEWELPLLGKHFLWEELLESYNNAPQTIFGSFEKALNWLKQGMVNVDGLMHVATPLAPDFQVQDFYQDITKKRIQEPFIVYKW